MAAKNVLPTAASPTVIKIPKANIEQIRLKLRGIGAGLLVHRFGETQMEGMEAPGLGEARQVRPKRDYDKEFNEARYIVDGKDCYPTAAIKKTVVEACSFVEGVFKTTARGAF